MPDQPTAIAIAHLGPEDKPLPPLILADGADVAAFTDPPFGGGDAPVTAALGAEALSALGRRLADAVPADAAVLAVGVLSGGVVTRTDLDRPDAQPFALALRRAAEGTAAKSPVDLWVFRTNLGGR
ncbi:MAG: hypothetical protein AAF318_14640 [Pseudomonadota bacterium]